MTNDRISQIEARIATRSEQRDAELSELRESIGVLIAEQGALKGQHEALTGAVEALRGVKPTSVLALVSPAIAAAIMVGSLGGFVLSQAIGPLEKDLVDVERKLDHLFGDMTGAISKMQDRQDDVRTRLAYLEGQAAEVNKRLDDVDKNGSRKWVGKQEK